MELYGTEPKDLDKFIGDRLQPDQKFLGGVRQAIDTICTFLRENCFKDDPQLPRPRVLKGGSLGKGTALKGCSDADLVVFLSTLKKYKDQEQHRKEIILEIQRRLEEFKNKGDVIDVIFEPNKWSNPRVLSFTLRSYDHEDSIEFDVLPAFDALDQTLYKPPPQVYTDLIDSNRPGGEFSSCFTKLQKDFIVDRPTKLKSLIRLLKHWYKEYLEPYESRLPPKYALELLAVHAWERGSGKTDFNMAEGFRTVLWLLQQYKDLCIFWTKYYDFQNEKLGRYLILQLQKPKPVILDPADPTGVLGEGSRWDLLAQKAKYWCDQKCCTNVRLWKVPVSLEKEASYSNPQNESWRYIPVSYQTTPARPASERPVQWREEVNCLICPGCGISRPLPDAYPLRVPERQEMKEEAQSYCTIQ